MDQAFDSQLQAMQAAFARDGVSIEVAYTHDGQADYVYLTDRLLVVNRPEIIQRIGVLLPGTDLADEQPAGDLLRVLSIARPLDGYRTVPEALDLLDAELGKDFGRYDDEQPAERDDRTLVTPVHVLHLAQATAASGRICPATEPEVPCCCAAGRTGRTGRADRADRADGAGRAGEDCAPCPPPAPGSAGAGVLIGICDTGLLANIAGAPWLAGVTGEIDPLGPLLAGVPPIPAGLHAIPRYTGHGTFAAGVARCQAPGADVYVSNHILTGGGIIEYVLVERLEAMIARTPAPQVVNLSAGGYTRHDLAPLSFTAFNHGGITLTAAAGNDATHRKFWPAAFPWAVGVGALGADQRDRAWFSNYGDWVKVYTLGDGVVNAYPTGVYTYQEPPKRPAQQIFDGMARWSGTSFAAPLVAGLIAAQMSSAGATAADATAMVLSQAAEQAIPGVGPALYPWHP
jgi:subtilisin family serine protease